MAQSQSHNTYLPGYAASNVKHHEWRTAENSAMYLMTPLQSMAKGNPKLTLLDVGAGSGTISASLAKYMPHGHVTATDLSEKILERAADHAKEVGVSNISFQPASVYELPFPDNSFNVVHAHQMLCHLDSPVEALKEMIRVVSVFALPLHMAVCKGSHHLSNMFCACMLAFRGPSCLTLAIVTSLGCSLASADYIVTG